MGFISLPSLSAVINSKKGNKMTKKELKEDIKYLSNSLNEFEAIFKECIIDKMELHRELRIANKTIADQIKLIQLLNSQLDQQYKANERKDKQFEGLKACYKDVLINGHLG